jgi:hypothetical protein
MAGKSRRFPGDIHQMYAYLETRRARVYPTRDLIASQQTLGQLLNQETAR